MPQTDNAKENSRTGISTRGNASSTNAYLTHYEMLGVEEDATQEELKLAFRSAALLNHPDKGGDPDTFHELQMAFNALDNQKLRDAYDEELRAARERASLVEGAADHPKEAKSAPARVKTAPTPGSKRGKKVAGMGGGEWKGLSTGHGILKAIEDGAPIAVQAEQLFQKYKDLPHHKEKKREWLNGISGEKKIELKKCAKAHEAEQKKKLDKWLHPPPPPAPKPPR
jgi:curved DNA-binding protein CbpA